MLFLMVKCMVNFVERLKIKVSDLIPKRNLMYKKTDQLTVLKLNGHAIKVKRKNYDRKTDFVFQNTMN